MNNVCTRTVRHQIAESAPVDNLTRTVFYITQTSSKESVRTPPGPFAKKNKKMLVPSCRRKVCKTGKILLHHLRVNFSATMFTAKREVGDVCKTDTLGRDLGFKFINLRRMTGTPTELSA